MYKLIYRRPATKEEMWLGKGIAPEDYVYKEIKQESIFINRDPGAEYLYNIIIEQAKT